MGKWIWDNIISDGAFVYFALNLFITYVFVRAIVKNNDKKNWEKFRHNYAHNLFERSEELLEIFRDHMQAFKPYRAESEDRAMNRDRRHYNLDAGTTLRKFGLFVTHKRNEIRQSMELGFVGINGELSQTITGFQECLEDLHDLINFILQYDNATGAETLTDKEVEKLTYLLSKYVAADGTAVHWKMRNNITRQIETVTGPFTELRIHITNFSASVGYAERAPVKPIEDNDRDTAGKAIGFIEDGADPDLATGDKISDKFRNRINQISRVKFGRSKRKRFTYRRTLSGRNGPEYFSENTRDRFWEFTISAFDVDTRLQRIFASYHRQLVA